MDNQPDGENSIPDVENELEAFLINARSGDERAFEMLYKELNPRLLRYTATQCHGSTLDYEEIMSEAWISVARDISKFKGGFAQFRSWVYSITRNRIIDASRKRERQVKSGGSVEEFDFDDSTPRADSLIESDEAIASIVTEIKKLPHSQSEVVLLRVVGDLSIEETSQIVGKSINSVRVLSHRGLTTLREVLQRGDGSNG